MKYIVRCFLIDNDEEDREIFNMALKQVDPSILCYFADNGVSAIRILKDDLLFVPSYIFIDMNMPLMNGVQCLQELKKIDRLNGVPMYMYSTTVDPESMDEMRRLGASDFIVKPASFTELTNLLSKLLEVKEIYKL